MKKIVLPLLLLFMLVSKMSYGQLKIYPINFETKNYSNLLFIDTSNHKNIWQIGKPSKSIFDSAFSKPNALVTDTLNSYPINDTSRFIIINSTGPNYFYVSTRLIFWYKLNTDSLKDFGTIEISLDRGLHWYNITNNDSICKWQIWQPNTKPILTGSTNGWAIFQVTFYNGQLSCLGNSDSIYYRFTFISDSIQTNKDGWMLDNIVLETGYEGIEEVNSNNFISVFPNPANDEIKIETKTHDHAFGVTGKLNVQLFDVTGKNVTDKISLIETATISTQNISQGIYFLRITDENFGLVKMQKVAVVK